MNGNPDRIRRRARPAHPPFTDFPLAAYVFAAAFDLISAISGGGHRLSQQLWHAGTFVLIAGLAICLITMGTGFLDLVRFPPRSPGVVRTVATHVCLMAAVFMVGAGDVAWRLSDYRSATSAPAGLVALSVTAAVVACTGAFFGGKLVFGHGIGVAREALAAEALAAEALAADKNLPGRPVTDDHGAARGERTAPAAMQPPPQPDTLA
jgi:uncharacterized membrane protein